MPGCFGHTRVGTGVFSRVHALLKISLEALAYFSALAVLTLALQLMIAGLRDIRFVQRESELFWSCSRRVGALVLG